MRTIVSSAVVAAVVTLLASCSRDEPAASPQQNEVAIDACSLLTAEKISAVLGAAPQEKNPGREERDGMNVSRCEYVLPDPGSSVTISVTQIPAGRANNLHKNWDAKLPDEGRETDGARRVPGLGDGAYWRDSTTGGVLHIRQGNRHIELTLGATGTPNQKIDKAEELGEALLKSL